MPGLDLIQDAGEMALRPASLVSDAFHQRAVLAEIDHRPWPLPDRPWFMGQSWLDLLFAHWRVPEEALRQVVPEQLPIDTYDGDAWLGITPFCVSGLRLRGTAPAPGLSSFPELNVRTYVSVEDKPGIYFLSLDADSAAAVRAARLTYRLPYFHSQIQVESDEEGISYDLLRVSDDGPPAYFTARYGAEGPELPIRDGSLERWLTERYCLYTLDDRGRILRGEIHHPPCCCAAAGRKSRRTRWRCRSGSNWRASRCCTSRPARTSRSGRSARFESAPAGHSARMNDDLSKEPQRPGAEAPADEYSAGENICPVCGGSGEKDDAQCPHCEGTGRVIEPIGGG